MKNQLDEQLILLLELVESLSVIVSEIKTHTRSIIDQSVNKSPSITILKKDDSLMKHSKIGQLDERAISLLEIIETLSGLLSEISKNTTRKLLNNEFYLTDKEISARLKVSRRTLQEWRYGGRISYFQVGGKILFRESNIQALLDKNLRKAFR